MHVTTGEPTPGDSQRVALRRDESGSRLRLGRWLRAGVSAAAALLMTACTGGERVADAPAPRILSAQERDLNTKSFDQVWDTVQNRHWDPTLGGLDWAAVKTELRPKVEQAATMNEARSVMRDAIGRLRQSHFGILDAEYYEQIDPAAEPDASTSDSAKASPGTEQPRPESLASREPGESGIGIRIVDGQALVAFVAPRSGADAAGVKPGWILRSVKDRDIAAMIESIKSQFEHAEAGAAMLTRAIESHLDGNVGDVIEAVFIDGNNSSVSKSVTLQSPEGKMVTMGNLPPMWVDLTSTRLSGADVSGVGYIRFNAFFDPPRIMGKFEEAMKSFAGSPGVIIDLRGNPGGIGFMASGMGSYFVDKDGLKLGEMRTRETTINFVIFPRAEVYAGPLAILVDELSLSTSEIMAGGLQDIGRARIFGTRTGGAALPSTVEKLPNGDRFQFVIANYTSASGRVLEGNGVEPDEVVPPDRATLLSGKDPVIEAALRWIGSRASESASLSGS